MIDQLIALGIAIAGALSIVLGAYFKGRKDKDTENKADNMESAQDAKQDLEEIKSIDNDDDFIKRVRDSER